MSLKVNLYALDGFTDAQATHFRNSAALLEAALNYQDFRQKVMDAPYRETLFAPVGARRVSKQPNEIADIILQGLERGTSVDNEIDLAIYRDLEIKRPVVGSTTVGVLPFRTADWFISGCTASQDIVSPARHMIHEWLHVAGFVHKRNNGYRKDVSYLVGDIVRSIILNSGKNKSFGPMDENREMSKSLDDSMDHVHD